MIKINICPVNFGSINVLKCAPARSSARLRARKNLKCSKSSQIFVAYISGHLEHLTKNHAYAHARAFFARTSILQRRIAEFSLFSYLAHFSKHSDNLFTFLKRTERPSKLTARQVTRRACVIFIHNTWPKTCLYKIHCNSSE